MKRRVSFILRAETQESLISQFRDYLQLTKPRIVALAVTTVAVGYIAGTDGSLSASRLAVCLIVMAALAAACGILNQIIEAPFDAAMHRTSDRAISGGRVAASEALRASVIVASIGVIGSYWVFGTLTGSAAVAVLATYIGVYTPLKRRTFLGTIGGAVSGAIPPVLGWLAAGRALDSSAMWMFLFVFAWQFPHFLAIATVYDRDYASVGYRMSPTIAGRVSLVGFVATLYAAVGIPIFVMVGSTGLLSSKSSALGLWMSVVYLWLSLSMWRFDDKRSARRLMLFSLLFVTFVFGAVGYKHLVTVYA